MPCSTWKRVISVGVNTAEVPEVLYITTIEFLVRVTKILQR